jgi:hypothetical protein
LVQVVHLFLLLELLVIMDQTHASQGLLHLVVAAEAVFRVNIPDLQVDLVVVEEMADQVEPH